MNSTDAKSYSLYKANTSSAKVLTELVFITTFLVRYLVLVVSALFSVLSPNSTCLLTHVDISQAFVQGELLPGDVMESGDYISPD